MLQGKWSRMKLNVSCGTDEIHPMLMIKLADYIADPLAQLFNRTLSDGQIPDDWKKAYVSPIFKKGAKNKASIVCKIMEKLIKEKNPNPPA